MYQATPSVALGGEGRGKQTHVGCHVADGSDLSTSLGVSPKSLDIVDSKSAAPFRGSACIEMTVLDGSRLAARLDMSSPLQWSLEPSPSSGGKCPGPGIWVWLNCMGDSDLAGTKREGSRPLNKGNLLSGIE